MTSTIQATVDASALARLFALAGTTFVYVTFEVFPVGLLNDIADSLDVADSQVGLLARGSVIVAALTHGVVWSLVAPAAANLVPRERVGTATVLVLTIAPAAVTIAIFGVAGAAGTFLIGRYLDIAARRAEIVTMTMFAAAPAALSLTLLPIHPSSATRAFLSPSPYGARLSPQPASSSKPASCASRQVTRIAHPRSTSPASRSASPSGQPSARSSPASPPCGFCRYRDCSRLPFCSFSSAAVPRTSRSTAKPISLYG
ncbi:MAG: hypothetical protein LKI58_13245 [Actinomyces sp.]|jgi:predicted MFS family arabinose efflux permease|nr:hypothetical protein [Actinomyces sp.]MCI1788997.1 hypothetical protein [Actinomyces sp.]MCI1830422.1 hypothetical protein [Actinomyces sp.]